MTSRSTGEVAVTVAVRGLSVMSAISPSQSPGPSSAILRPLLVTCAVPEMRTKNSRPDLPSRVSTVPSRTSSLVRRLRELAELVLRAAREQRNLLQELDLRIAAQRHGAILIPGRTRSRELGMSAQRGYAAARADCAYCGKLGEENWGMTGRRRYLIVLGGAAAALAMRGSRPGWRGDGRTGGDDAAGRGEPVLCSRRP